MGLLDEGKRGSFNFAIKLCDHGENPIWKRCKKIRSDNGLKFLSGSMKQFYLEKGIIHHKSCINTPQQNGRVERKHRHILNVARALHFQASLPIEF